jgi:hypothetical protein
LRIEREGGVEKRGGVVPKKKNEEDEEIVFVYKIFQDIFSLDLQSYFVK